MSDRPRTQPTERGLFDGPRHRDRREVRPWLMRSFTLAAVLCTAVAGHAVAASYDASLLVGGGLGSLIALLALYGLPSVSLALVGRLLVLVSAAVMVRFGSVTGSLGTGSQLVLAWVAGAVAVLVLADRVTAGASPPPRGERSDTGRELTDLPVTGEAAPSRTLGNIGLVAALVILVALVLVPLVMPHAGSTTASGQGPRGSGGAGPGGSPLTGSDSLDASTWPQPTDDVVFTVDGDRPEGWRSETFDLWDGSEWTRSDRLRYQLSTTGDLVTSPTDLGASGPVENRQTIRIEATYADVLVAAASAVSVEAPWQVAQRLDGTLTVGRRAVGRGATYTVSSRSRDVSPAVLRASDRQAVPPEILERYAAPPQTSDRVLEAATEATADASTTYDKVKALEAWMGRQAEYSLSAPIAPAGADVVDHFLFDSQLGWCNQTATSLVVLARANGIPARMVTGFTPGERDPVSGAYVVRNRNYHAWAEVWFPEAGWVAFDPTAALDVADAGASDNSWGEWLVDNALLILIAGAGAAGLAWLITRLVRRQRKIRAERPTTWAAVTDRRLHALGERVDRARGASETATAHAEAVARLWGRPRLTVVGLAVDDAVYAADPPDQETREAVDRILSDVESLDPPDPPSPPDSPELASQAPAIPGS